MLNRIHNYICHQIPNIFENMKNTHHRRQVRMEELTIEQDTFIQSFLNNNQYFYMASTEKFYFYDGIHYQIYNEDDILYNVLSSITRGGQLMSWKQRTRINIMKRIKDNNLLKTIPESETIQYVLDLLYPALFQTKSEAKYFLTIVGDNIFKKNGELIHFVHPKSKRFIQELNNFSQAFIGLNLSQTFKYKYHEHEYELCRLLKMSEGIKFQHQWEPILNNSVLDLICVACHYSTRYNSSDEYVLYANNDDSLTANAFYLKNVNQPELVYMFVNEYLEFVENPSTIVSENLQINWKSMLYLWKQFLDSKNLPTIMFQQTLKHLLIQKTPDCYDETLDLFVGVYSKHLPAIQKFLAFWEETITMVQENEPDQEFEIDEICTLFKQWGQIATGNTGIRSSSICNVTDKQILDLISYFFPTIEMEREKFIYKIKCSLWDKNKDIQTALDLMKIHLRTEYITSGPHSGTVTENCFAAAQSHPLNGIFHDMTVAVEDNNNQTSLERNGGISIYDAYMFYCKSIPSLPLRNSVNFLRLSSPEISQIVNQQSLHHKPVVSKSYFEKYVMDTFSEYILESTFLSNQWLHSL
jgi:hypothetical protein